MPPPPPQSQIEQEAGERKNREISCGLQWHEHAVEVQNRSMVSQTASAAQIRRPIYSSSTGRWRRYRRHLEPLVQALRRLSVCVADEDESGTRE
jgi:hypothetical protein